jgi:WD40 repeat protein
LNAFRKWCAVKIVYRDEGESRAYHQEFRGLRRYDELSGTSVSLMPVKSVGQDPEGRYFYYAMELADDATTRAPLPMPDMEGRDFERCLAMAAEFRPWTLSEELRRRGRLTPEECVEHGIELAGALETIHAGGLVHRDVKPSNIIFVQGRPKLADVGLVASTDASLRSLAGTSGFVPLYGAGTESGDVFALGKVLYLMATGRAVEEFPGEAEDLAELGEEKRRAWAELRAVYDRASDTVPDDRHSSARELREELQLLRRNESVLRLRQLEEERVVLQEQGRRQRLRNRIVAVMGLTILLAVSGVFSLKTMRDRAAHEALLLELELMQLSRMQERREGWSADGWESAQRAVRLRSDDRVLSHAVAVLSGLDARHIGYWRDVEATAAAVSDRGEILLAGRGINRSMLILNQTNRFELAVAGEGKVTWSGDGFPLILLEEEGACVVRGAECGTIRGSFALRPGERVNVLKGPALALSADGRMAAASLVDAEGERRVVLWSVEDGKVLGSEEGWHATALAFSGDGEWLAAGNTLGKIKLFSLRPFRDHTTLRSGLPPNPITALAFGRDRKTRRTEAGPGMPWILAAGDLGTGIVVWDLSIESPRAYCRGSTWNVQSLAFHPDGQTLASAGRNGVMIWDAMTGGILLALNRSCTGDARALAFDPSGRYLVAGTTAEHQFGEVSVWELEWHRGIQQLRGLTTVVRKTWFSPDNRLVGALSDEWLLALWDTGTGQLNRLMEVEPGQHADSAGCAMDPVRRHLAFAAGTQATLYDLDTGAWQGSWRVPAGQLDELRYDSAGRLWLVQLERQDGDSGHWMWQVYELIEGGAVRHLRGQTDLSYSTVSFALPMLGDGLFLVTRDLGTLRNDLMRICLDTGQVRWRVPTQLDWSWLRLRVDMTGRWLTSETGRSPSTTGLFDGQTGHLLEELSRHCLAVSTSGGLRVIPDDNQRSLFIENTITGGRALVGFDGRWNSDTVLFSPDERWVAAGNDSGTVLLADIEEVRLRLEGLRARSPILEPVPGTSQGSRPGNGAAATGLALAGGGAEWGRLGFEVQRPSVWR